MSEISVWKRIGRSWLSMKTWVKGWLWFLNIVFWGAFAFRYDPLGDWTIAAYAASGPLLLGLALWRRGLSRILGIAHLIPWIPLLIYLAMRLSGDSAGPRILLSENPALFRYSWLLLSTVGICLVFDAYDLARWLRGERFVLGSPEAADVGASKLADL